ncbi:MAG: DUF167 domain-containing protein [Promethearchaeia archaeon]
MEIHQIKESKKNIFLLQVYVKPNSRRERIKPDGDFIAISVKAKARRNKANKDLIKLLRNRLNISSGQIQILSGTTNTDKIIQIDYSHEEEKISEKEIKKQLYD